MSTSPKALINVNHSLVVIYPCPWLEQHTGRIVPGDVSIGATMTVEKTVIQSHLDWSLL